MLSIGKLSVGQEAYYLEEVLDGAEDYYLHAGEAPGRWLGAGATFTGGRRAQLLALRWRNVDIEAGRLSFTGGWVEGPDGPVLAATKTKRRHAMDLDLGSLDVLAAHADRARAASGGLRREGFVFSDTPDGATA